MKDGTSVKLIIKRCPIDNFYRASVEVIVDKDMNLEEIIEALIKRLKELKGEFEKC